MIQMIELMIYYGINYVLDWMFIKYVNCGLKVNCALLFVTLCVVIHDNEIM